MNRELSGNRQRSVTARRLPPDEGMGARNTLRYIILGLLGAHPMSGYDIKRAFDRALASYWNAGNSQIYTTLKALSQDGLVEAELVVQDARPNKKIYHLTPAGEAALRAWLADSVPERFTKDEFLTKLFFCGQTDDATALRHLREHRDTLMAQIAYMEQVRREYSGRSSRRPRLLEFQLLVRDYKAALLQADFAVTEQAIQRLEARIKS